MDASESTNTTQTTGKSMDESAAVEMKGKQPEPGQSFSLFKGYHYPMEVYYKNWESGGFTLLSLDLTSRCNYDCDWCSNKTVINQSDPDILTLDERIKVLEEASELGARTLIAVGVGEPTLDPDFYTMVKVARERGMTTVLYSNITGRMDKERISFLYENDVSIAIKLDSFNMNHFLHRNHTKMAGFYRFLRNFMHILTTYKGSMTTEERDGVNYDIHRVIGNMVINLENKPEIEHMAALCEEFGVPLFIRPIRPVEWAERDMDNWRKLGNPTGKLIPHEDLVATAEKHNTLFAPSSTAENHCAIYSFGLVLRNNGDVLVCPDNEKTRGQFGNIRTRPLKDIAWDLKEHRIVKSGYCDMLPTIDHTNPVAKEMAHIVGATKAT